MYGCTKFQIMEGAGLSRFKSHVIITVCTLMVITFCTSVKCPAGQYCDPAAERCDFCYNLCHFAVIHATTEECEKNCPLFHGSCNIKILTYLEPSYYNESFVEAMERQLSNPSRRHKRSLEGQECPDYYYYDTAISECTPCDHLCDDHEYQGTTGQCIDKCPKYYQRMSAELTTPLTSTSTVKSTPSITTIMDTYPVHPAKKGGTLEGDKGNAILAVVVAILVLAVAAAIGYLIWRKLFRKRDRTCCRRCRREKVKTPVTCSEEDSIDALGASQKPLLCGPIRQAENCPQQELSEVKQPLPTTDSYPYNMTFAEIGGARYAVLDDPLTSVRHSTIPKETYSTANADTDDSHVTVPKELSATANTDSCDSHITLPKETCSSVSSEHLNCKDTQSHKLEEKCYNVSKS